MKLTLIERFGFLVSDTGRLYGRVFDQRARQQLGLSLAQCRLLGALAAHQGKDALSQAELADRLDLTPMGVATLCDRMQAAGWLRRVACPQDRRVNKIELLPPAYEALTAAMALGDELQAQAQQGLSEEEAARLRVLLRKVHGNLSALMVR
ncbi:MarR family winged helix-turn-helix transcriptional regulator [Chromobacterium sp. IIBBL 290-4]|uniref:MarR family winged helix-turn-helix transcriptional regulator n=1 Tax=Chromobacterium sp. IIBBL 290-4 TaxID=2953890 RepID=UPI0020B67F99|nr:MarR family winged helix-turn-helix transcriptional regulator [Chromobacterium sp. IIBBL 290-4]UTH72974.1 MarR family winged helix-turn-helix transcriptional regulator [Chromobacterium sp. IIBBL 290-4]